MYKFTKINEDTWKLEYNGQEYEIKKDLEKVVQLQQVDFEANAMFVKKLKDLKMTIEDVEFKKEENGKTIINDSKKQELLEICKKEAIYNKIKKLINDITGLDILQLAIDLRRREIPTIYTRFCIDFKWQ